MPSSDTASQHTTRGWFWQFVGAAIVLILVGALMFWYLGLTEVL